MVFLRRAIQEACLFRFPAVQVIRITHRIFPQFCVVRNIMSCGGSSKSSECGSSRPNGGPPILSDQGSSSGSKSRKKSSVRAEQINYSSGVASVESKIFKSRLPRKRRARLVLTSEERIDHIETPHHGCPLVEDSANERDSLSLPTEFGKRKTPGNGKRSLSGRRHFKGMKPASDFVKVKPFDICSSDARERVVDNSSICEKDEEKESNARGQVLRPGMVILKDYISISDQIKIVKTCRQLGVGRGGFYRPGYQNGAKLNLQMMCLGLNWDPQTRKYEDRRATDGSETPKIPSEFDLLVKKAIKDAHSVIEKNLKPSDVEDMMPAMSPNICIINFYTTKGKLGLHQDRDESKESLRQGLPVVSFSVGDSAEFLYGDQRDANQAAKVILESGDVLIFGGPSRHIFHGVTTVISNSAPKHLLEESLLRPGRLNLTFRQF
ncbi:hypothetical protein Tsubulata_015688 [Turnera subulata]|uniref:DNA N(6)-methyladenine demethylase n=1 Tax=Turnera subulata TaxID=218843 RepID=A0A9Q0G1E5_9ROSI|nr:hypothetical protein Tsubulata_015688 [Turnera subulata]